MIRNIFYNISFLKTANSIKESTLYILSMFQSKIDDYCPGP